MSGYGFWISFGSLLLTLLGYGRSILKGKRIGESFAKGVLNGKARLTKVVFAAKVAEIGLLLDRLVQADLIDGKPDELDAFRGYLIAALNRCKA